jgi:hypothetical protein
MTSKRIIWQIRLNISYIAVGSLYYKILFFVYLKCFQGWSESAADVVVGMIGRFFLSLFERGCFGDMKSYDWEM